MLHLNLRLDQDSLPAEGDAVRHLVARIVPPEPDGEREVPPLDLALVIDASGSMSGPRLDAAKQAAAGVARSLSPTDRLTLVSFADDVVVHVEGEVMEGPGLERALDAIARLQTRGCTNLSAGWLAACQLLIAGRFMNEDRRQHVVVLSDGRANKGIVDPQQLAFEARSILGHGVATSAVGIGDGYSTACLAAITDNGGGLLHDAETPQEIVEIVLGEVRGLADVVAERVDLVLQLPNGVRATELSGAATLPEANRLTVSIGAVRAGVTRSVAVRLVVPAGVESIEVTGQLVWAEPGNSERLRAEPVRVHAVRSPEPAATPALEDVRIVLVAWEAGLVQRVTELNRDGEFEAIM
jgi:Ca-activated chloride channel family protein